MRSDSAKLLSPSEKAPPTPTKPPSIASSSTAMSARSDDFAAAAAAASAAASIAQSVAEGAALPPNATEENMAAGAALSPPASPRASGDFAVAAERPFAFDTARLASSRSSPPPSPEMRPNDKKAETLKDDDDAIPPPSKLHREPLFSNRDIAGDDNETAAAANAAAAASAAAAAAAAAAARLSAAEATATDFVRTRRAIQLRLVLEIERKLRLADESAELKADRDAICGEVFSDVTGEVDEASAARLGIPWHGPSSTSTSRNNIDPSTSSASAPSTSGRERLPDLGRHHSNQNALFYEVLAPFLAANPALADALLGIMKRLWGQAYVAPIYALLLHRWLLTHRDAGLRRDRTKHVHVLAIGAQQLFWADVHSDALRFQPLFSWLAGAVALDPRRAALDALPLQCRAGLLAVVAAFLPYYATSPRAFAAALRAMPSPKTLAPPPRGCPHDGGVDLVLTEAADMMGLLKSDSSILVWLESLRGIAEHCPDLLSTRKGGASRAVRLRLQSSLHGLTARGGPRYLSPTVRSAAFESLDALFPAGAAPRRVVAVLAAAWARVAAVWMSTGAGAALAAASGAGGFWGLFAGAPVRAVRATRWRFAGMFDDALRANVVPAFLAAILLFTEVVARARRGVSRALSGAGSSMSMAAATSRASRS